MVLFALLSQLVFGAHALTTFPTTQSDVPLSHGKSQLPLWACSDPCLWYCRDKAKLIYQWLRSGEGDKIWHNPMLPILPLSQTWSAYHHHFPHPIPHRASCQHCRCTVTTCFMAHLQQSVLVEHMLQFVTLTLCHYWCSWPFTKAFIFCNQTIHYFPNFLPKIRELSL